MKFLITSAPSQLIKKLFGDLTASKRSKLLSEIVDTRNYYTHRDEKVKYPNAVCNIEELDNFIEQLLTLLKYYCLTTIGVNPEIVEQRLIENY